MKYLNLISEDIINGEGFRVVLWVSGCSLGCKGCFNKESWNRNSGKEFTEETKNIIIQELKKPYISGLTLTGGHPLEKYNIPDVTKLCKELKELFPNKTIWLYTGLMIEDIMENFSDEEKEFLKYIDVMVDGKFEEDKKADLKFRGSYNQRIIKIKDFLNEN